MTPPSTIVGETQAGPLVVARVFDAYAREHGRALCRSAFLLTGDHHLAEDLVQTVLAKVAPRWDRIAADADPTPYVHTVIVRTAIAWRRWRGEVPTAPMPEPGRGRVSHDRPGRAVRLLTRRPQHAGVAALRLGHGQQLGDAQLLGVGRDLLPDPIGDLDARFEPFRPLARPRSPG